MYSSAETIELWSKDKKARAVCENSTSNRCYIVVAMTEIDISSVEGANLGKLGIRSSNEYSKIINFPSKWLKASNDEYLVNITTQAWFEAQRYTVTEPVYIKDGVYLPR